MKPSLALRSFLLGATLLASAPSLVAQTIFDWRSDAPDGNWTQGASGARWDAGGLFDNPGFGSLRFNNNHELTMTNNVIGTYNMHGFIFGVLGTSARTLNGNTVRLFDSGGTDPFISNDSSATHVINLNLEGDGDAIDPLKVNLNSTGGLTFGGTINNQGSTIDVQGSGTAGTVSFNGAISGGGGMTKANANTTLVLGASNSYTGGTTLSAGTLQLRHANSLGTGSPGLSISSGTTLQLRNDVNTTFAHATVTAPTTGVTYNFDVNNAGSAVTNKTLSLGNITFATNTSNLVTNRINVTGGNGYTLGLGTISAPSSASSFNPVIIDASTAAVTIAKFATGSFGSALTLQGGNAITLSNLDFGSNGNNSLTVSGSGTVVTLGTTTTGGRTSGTSAYTLNTGATLNLTTTTSLANVRNNNSAPVAATFTINGGTLNNTNGSALNLAANGNNTAGSPTVNIAGSFTFGTAGSNSSNNLNLGSGPSGTISADRTITLAGTGTTLTLPFLTNTSGNTTQTTTVNGAGNTLSIAGYNLSANNIPKTSTFAGSGNVNFTAAVLNGGGSAAKNLAYSGTGTLTLSAANQYTGTTAVATGNVVAGTDSLVSTNGAFGNANTDVTFGTASGNGNASILIGGAFNVGRIIRNATADATDAGTRILTLGGNTAANSTFSGNIFLGTTNQTSKGIVVTAANGGQVTFSGVIQNPTGQTGAEITAAAALTAVTKSGLGTVVLSNTNTYTGATTVSAGTLAVNGSISSSATTVETTGILTGTGVLGSSLTVNSTGVVNAGTVGTINTTASVTGATNFESGSIFSWDLSANGATGDKLTTDSVTGPIAGDAIFRILLADGTVNNAFFDNTHTNFFAETNIISSVSDLTALFSTVQVYSGITNNAVDVSSRGFFTLTSSGVSWSAVPEPTSALAGLLLTAGLLRRRRN